MSMNFVVRMSFVAALAVGTFSSFGCGDDDGSSSGGDSGTDTGDRAGSSGGGGGAPSTVEPGEKTSKEITAADGGEVSLGGVTASIPAGALADDTTITVEVLDPADQPGANDIVADVFDFGPDGTEFLKPVTLEFDVGDLKVPSGSTAMIAFLDGNEWTTLEDSELSGGKVTASTTHFTPFTVVLVLNADGGVTQVGGQCAPDDFDACGGDLVGTWEYSGACLTLPSDFGGSNPDDQDPFAMCTDKPQFAATVDLTGTTTFNSDGTYSLDQTLNISSQLTIPASCVDTLTMGMLDTAMACDQILMGTIDADGNCVGAAGDPEMKMNTGSGTWSADGGKLTIEDTSPPDGGVVDAGAPKTPDDVSYCVTGDSVVVVSKNADEGFVIQYTATRK
jgi:hypothetical protein